MRICGLFLARVGLLLPCLAAIPQRAQAEEPAPPGFERYRTPLRSSPDYWQTFGSLSLGRGLRFNNPYRLQTSLGKTPESVSATATYVDLGWGGVYGPPNGLAHGAVLHLSIAAQGIPQEVLSASYVGLERFASGRTTLFGRFGIPVVLEPDLTAGLEAGFGGAFLVTSGLGVQSEVVGSVFYGAGTLDRSVTTIPVVSLEVGLYWSYEVLP